MGTNYYVQTPPCPSACEHCDASQRIHLGKSSGGWRFFFRADPEWPRAEAFTRWLHRATAGRITDEYGGEHTIGELLAKIHAKAEDRSHADPDERHLAADRYTDDGHDFNVSPFS